MMEQTYGCCFDFPCEYGNPPNIHGIRGLATEKWPSSSVWFSACRILGKLSSFKEGKAFTESVSRPLSCMNHFASKMWVLSCCSECLNTRVKAMCLPALFYPWKQIPSSFRYGSWGYCCGSVSESVGCHAVVTSSRWHSTANWPVARSCEPPARFRNSKGWRRVKLALSQVWKQHSDGFSCSC